MMKFNDLTIEKFKHDTILVQNGLILYFDPYNIDMVNMPRADVVFISHHHYDHCSPKDLEKVIKNDTVIIASLNCQELLSKFQQAKHFMQPGDQFEYKNMKILAVPAYNLNKYRSPGQFFHPKEDKGVGFVVETEGVKLYFAGDTDNIPEMAELKGIDIAFLPVSGTYVMTVEEAHKVIGQFKPKFIVPMHYGDIVGGREQAEELKKMVQESEVRILD